MNEPELLLDEQFLSDSQELYTALAFTVDWDARMQSRKTATFGKPYNYSGITYAVINR